MIAIALLTDLAVFLASNGFGTYDPSGSASTIFTDTIPDGPDTLIALEEYVGIASPTAWTLDGATLPRFELPRVHVTVRGLAYDYLGPRSTIEKIYQLFLQTKDTPINGTQVNRITPQGSGIFALPVNSDVNGRRLLVANFEVMRALTINP